MLALVLLHINQHKKFELPSFSYLQDMIGAKNLNKKLSYRRETAQRTMSVDILSTAAQLYEKITCRMTRSRKMTL